MEFLKDYVAHLMIKEV